MHGSIISGRFGEPSNGGVANRLLCDLPDSERAWVEQRSVRVSLARQQVLYRQGQRIDRLYFPDSGVVSLVSVMSGGESAEIGTIGPEGVVGVHTVFGCTGMPCDAIVQVAGSARVLRLDDIWADSRAGGALSWLLCQYGHALLLQTMQTAACNTVHPIRERAARWILTMHDAAGCDAFPLTQELLGLMLGARRQSVNAVARSLQRANAIDYRHGKMVVRDRLKLEAAACDCYAIIRDHFASLLGKAGAGRRQSELVRCPCCGFHKSARPRRGSVQYRTDRPAGPVAK